MANNNKVQENTKIVFASSYSRLNGQPLDATIVWDSLADAQDYAKTPTAYVGQILTVVTNEGSTVYVVNDEAGTLVEVDTPADSTLSSTSTNAIQNKIVYDALAKKADNHEHPYAASEHTHDQYYTETDVNNKLKISGTVTKDIGGIAKDKTYNETSIIDVLTDLLFPYVAPVFGSLTTSASSGTFEYGTRRTITSATPNFTKGSKEITSIKIGTTDGGTDLYSGTSATSGAAVTLKKSVTYNGSTGGTIYCQISDGTNIAKGSATVSYTYYDYSKLTRSTTPDTSGATQQNNSGADNTYTYNAGEYLWLYSRLSGKKIQQYISGTWADVSYTSADPLTLKLASGGEATYYAYRTGQFSKDGSARYRLA